MNPPDMPSRDDNPAAPKAPRAPDPAPHAPAPVDISEESIAGEEDPGASLDEGVCGPAPSPVPGSGRPPA